MRQSCTGCTKSEEKKRRLKMSIKLFSNFLEERGKGKMDERVLATPLPEQGKDHGESQVV